MDSIYYDGTKLLSLSDINGKKPEIYMVTGTRTAGKTTYFNRYVFNRWVKHKEKFMILVRFSYELCDIEDRFFTDIRNLFFPFYQMTSKPIVNGKFRELYVAPNDQEEMEECCGYVVALNDAGLVKKYAHLFSDTQRMIFDEFQEETNHYCPDEITKFRSIHVSVARGNGEQVRYVPVFMMANAVSIINPYFVAFGISNRLGDNTKFLKGKGFVLEITYNESASTAIKESAFNQAFVDQEYTKYATENLYLNDNNTFIEKMTGHSRYLCTIKFKNKEYAIRSYDDQGIVYCDSKADSTFPLKICVTTDDHDINYVMLKNNDLLIAKLRYFFNKGCFRFKDLNCKEAILNTLSY